MSDSREDFSGKIQIPPICKLKIELKTSNVCLFMANATQLSNCLEVEAEDVQDSINGFILVDARKRVEVNSKEIAIFGPLRLLHGSATFRDALSNDRTLTCLAILSGQTIKNKHDTDLVPQTQKQFGTLTERLEIGQQWVEVTIISEPFITPTAFGYAPALLVRTIAKRDKHILAGAKSLSLELEKFRHPKNGLTGIVVKIRKAGSQKIDPYEVELVSRS